MGSGGQKRAMHEIAETRAAGRTALFDEILEKVKAAGGTIDKDETAPLYIEVGMQEFEIGEKRTACFTLGTNEFEMTQKVEREVIQGSGRQKHVESLETPRITESLKKKNEHGEWRVIDLEDLA